MTVKIHPGTILEVPGLNKTDSPNLISDKLSFHSKHFATLKDGIFLVHEIFQHVRPLNFEEIYYRNLPFFNPKIGHQGKLENNFHLKVIFLI